MTSSAQMPPGCEIRLRQVPDSRRVVIEHAGPVIRISDPLFGHILADECTIQAGVEPSGEEDWSGTVLRFTDDEGRRLVYVVTGHDETHGVFTARFPG